jgi:crotonobetainyl-CoA:carnitine CoA-transferase CaiB-like acyl-CoA transferase
MLEGLRIADLTTVFFGPYCTQTLADMGADVIKVEPQGGDTSRIVGTPSKTDGMGPVHLRLNRGKRSVDWDLRSEAGRIAMKRLIETSDVFIHNIRTDAIARAGLTYDEVRKIKPDIIYVHCTGFGQNGPYAPLQAYDDIIQAASGIASLLPRVDGNPQPRYVPQAIADKLSSLHAVYAVLAACIHRMRTGEGQHIEVPMFESTVSFTLLEHLCDISYVPPTGPSCYFRQIDPARQPLRTKDGYIAIAPYLNDRWVRFFEVAGHPELMEDPELAVKSLRRMSRLYELAAKITPERSTDEWMALLAEANVPAMRVNGIEDLLDDPHLQATGMFRHRTHPSEGEYIEVRPPVRFGAYEYGEFRHATAVGESSVEVARELGVDYPAKASAEPKAA